MSSAQAEPIKYPDARREERVEKMHGVAVADPYRWLEDDVRKSTEVAAWVEAENKVTFAYLERIPEREAIQQAAHRAVELREVLAPRSRSAAATSSRKNDGLQNQSRPLHAWTRSTASRACCSTRTRWSKDGTVALAGTAVSDDGKLPGLRRRRGRLGLERLAGARRRHRQAAGRRAEVGQVLRRRLDERRQGLLLQPLRRAEAGRRRSRALNLNQKLYYHRLGTPQAEDVLVYERPDHPKWGFGGDVTDDGRYLVITIWKGTDEPQEPRRLQGPGRAAAPCRST